MIKFIGVYDYTVILTYMSLLSAVIGIIQAKDGNFTVAVICLIVSGVCDAFDGTIARSKKDRTEDEKAFGIQIDSLCDLVSFGVFPAFLCFGLGVSGTAGSVIVFFYCLCAVIRLAFFNVLEEKRQRVEDGCNKEYRGLPVTSISIILPIMYILKFWLTDAAFVMGLHIVLIAVAILFVLDFSMKKPDFGNLFLRK